MGFSELWLAPNGLAELSDGLVEQSLIHECDREAIVSQGAIGVELDSTAAFGDASFDLCWCRSALPKLLWAMASPGLSRIASRNWTIAAS